MVKKLKHSVDKIKQRVDELRLDDLYKGECAFIRYKFNKPDSQN